MIQNRLFSAALLIAGLAQASAALAASPQVIINQGQASSCTVTPGTGTIFTLDPSGNVLVNGTYTSGTCSTPNTGGSGSPLLSLAPNPADLTVPSVNLTSAGGTVNPNFVAYFANSCTGSVTQTAGCTAATWGSGGSLCTASTNATGQTYCSPNSAAVTLPKNTSSTTACVYTFNLASCTNGTNSTTFNHTASVTVPYGTTPTGEQWNCVAGSTTGDLGTFGYNQQCSGSLRSLNGTLAAVWNNTYSGLMSAPFPGAAAQMGYGLQITVNAMQYASFKIATGATASGVHFEANASYGTNGLLSISTAPGDFFGGTSLCVGSTLDISSRPGTTANCKLSTNSYYYLNVSNASYGGTHDTICSGTACTTGWTSYSYGG